MRWDYTAPEQKMFVSDGRRIYLYVPADNQVIVSPVPEQDEATTAVLFLVGKGNLTRDFTVSPMSTAAAPTRTSCGSSRSWPSATTTGSSSCVDRRTLQIRSLTAADARAAGRRSRFSNFKENVGLADKTFAFKIPRGADVISSRAPSR